MVGKCRFCGKMCNCVENRNIVPKNDVGCRVSWINYNLAMSIRNNHVYGNDQ